MRIRNQIYIGFSIILLILASIILISYTHSEKLIESTDSVLRAQEITVKIEEMMRLLLDAETGQRGYIITGKETFLNSYDLAIYEFPQHLEELENLIIEPTQKENIERLKPLIENEFNYLKETIDLRKNSGFEASREIVETGRGKVFMSQTRILITEMKDEEKRILAKRSQKPEEERKANNRLLMMLLIVGVLFGGVIAFFTSKSISKPLSNLTQEVDEITHGKLDIQLKKSNISEVQTLTDSLNRILASLKLAILRTDVEKSELGIGEVVKAKKEAEKKYQTLYESSSDAIMTLAPPDWKFTSGNPATIKLFKAKDEKEFTSKGPGDLSPEKQPDGQLSSDKAKQAIEKAIKEGSNSFEWTHKKLTGESFPAHVLLTKVNINEKDQLQATVRDMTSEKKEYYELERFVKLASGREEKMIELKKRQKELEKQLKQQIKK